MPTSYTRLNVMTWLARERGSEGAEACSLGREPQGTGAPNPKSPAGATAAVARRKAAVAPSGLNLILGSSSWGSRPRLHASAPSEPSPAIYRRAERWLSRHPLIGWFGPAGRPSDVEGLPQRFPRF